MAEKGGKFDRGRNEDLGGRFYTRLWLDWEREEVDGGRDEGGREWLMGGDFLGRKRLMGEGRC